jgi:predicted NBD/HSP70 family sugar kinase
MALREAPQHSTKRRHVAAVNVEWASGGAAGRQGPALSRGTSQSGVRLYNERLALSLIRRHGALPKAEIARLTGLSAQTVSVIVRQLEADGLLRKLKPQRGKVGQPLVPFTLNPDGAFAIGLKIGRRSSDLVLLDLAGEVRKTLHHPYKFPTPKELLGFVKAEIDELIRDLKPRQRQRISGLGIAAPFELWNWGDEVGAPRDVLDTWRDFDLQGAIASEVDWPVHFCNDATAACAAELLFGKGGLLRDFAYFYVGYFIGGGIVINSSLHQGRRGNAGALASFPVPAPNGGTEQHSLQRAGKNPAMLWQTHDDWPDAEPELGRWLDTAARSLAHAMAGVASVLDCTAMVIDGAMPAEVRSRLVQAARASLNHVNMQGISPFSIEAGTIGSGARAMGAASLPLFANFMIDRDVLFKEAL